MARVVILGSAWPLRGGLATYNERLAMEFMRMGHEVTIFTFSLQYPSFLFPGKTQYSDSPSPHNLDIRVRLNSVNPFSWLKTAREIARLKPDFLIIKFWLPFMGPAFGTVARIVKKRTQATIVSILDNVIPHEHRPGDKAFTKYFLKPVQRFVAMSDSVLKDLKKFTDKPVELIPHPLYDNFGMPEDKLRARELLGIDYHGPLVLFFGFIRDYKGLDILLKSIPLMQNKQVKVLVAGEFYSDAAPYHDLIDTLRIKESVLLHTDFIPDEKVRLYFSACDLVVQPYKTATQSGVTQIAYHFEKPMVVANVGGLPEMVPDGVAGYVVPVDPEEIGKAVDRFFDQDPEKFTGGIMELKKTYSWERMVNAIIKQPRS